MTPVPSLDAATLRRLPKAELHLHLDGSVRPTTAVELAAAIAMPLTPDEARRRLIGPPRCRDQAELLAYFDLPIALLQTPAALTRAAAELVETLAEDGVSYAEIRWAPRLHLERGMRVDAVIEAVARGIDAGRAPAAEDAGGRAPVVTLIVTAMRSHRPVENLELARIAAGFGPPVIGFDLAGPEAEYGALPHRAALDAATRAGLGVTAHAGEVPGTRRVAELLELGVTRIAHGVTAAQDERLLDEIRARDVTLDVCPTSNVQAGIVASLAEHPVRALHRAGISVTVSTDDRTVSNTTLSDELAAVALATGMAPWELTRIALNGFARAFAGASVIGALTDAARRAWLAWTTEARDVTRPATG